MEAKHTPGRLYYHKTDGGAEYLCAKPAKGTTEGDCRYAVVRLDGQPELLGVYPAAPALLAALEGLAKLRTGPTTLKHADWIAHVLNLAEAARAAIAKAKGE